MNPEIKKYIDEQVRSHFHNGLDSQRINFADIFGYLPTITDATTLTNVTTASPTDVSSQVFIDTSTGTKKLYIYDFTGKAWLSCTIS